MRTFNRRAFLIYSVLASLVFVASGVASAALPGKFAEVTANIYRGARPTADNLQDLQQNYEINTVVNIDNDAAVAKKEKATAQKLGLEWVSYPLESFSTPTDKDIDNILAQLENASRRNPIFIHCKHGEDRTGMIVGLYRVLYQGWPKQKAYDEMLKMGFHPFLKSLKKYFWDRTQDYP